MGAVYLVRHGQASFGAADYDVLSQLGAEQSRIAGRELSRRRARLTVARSGSLSRQLATTSGVLAECAPDLVAKEDPRWNEYDHLDIVTRHGAGASQADDPRAFQADLDNALAGWIAAGESTACTESWPAFRDRARAALHDVLAELGTGEHAVVVTSGGVLASLCASLLGTPDTAPAVIALNRVTVNAGLTKIVSGRAGISLVSFNDHGHLDGDNAHLLSYR